MPSDEEKQRIVDEKNIEKRAKLIADHPFIADKFNRLQANKFSCVHYIKIQRGHFKTNLNVGIDFQNRVGKRVTHAP